MYYDRPQKKKKKATKAPARNTRSGSVAISKKPQVKKKPVKKPLPRKKAPVKNTKRSAAGQNEWRTQNSHPLMKFICFVLLIVILVPVALYLLPESALNHRSAEDYGKGFGLPDGCTNVLLIGLDKNSTSSSRSDTMVILSVGGGRVCLTSLMRDTGVSIPGRDGTHRLNAAYNYGGAELLLKTINTNFGFDLTSYIAVDYESFPPLIDILGGVDISGISAAEVREINNNVYDVLRRRYDAGQLTQTEATAQYNAEKLSGSGDMHLDGLQALGYARIRKTDSDYGRTNRQRKVLSAALGKLKASIKNPVRLVRFAVKGLSGIETNMSAFELIALGEKALLSSSVAQLRLPADGTFKDEGGMFFNVDYQANYKKFREFVYGR